MKRVNILNKLLVGIIIILPLLLSVCFIVWIFKILLSMLNITPANNGIFANIIVIMTFVIVFLLTGFIATTKSGEKIITKVNEILYRIPVLNKFYIFFKQLIETIYFKRFKAYKKVVMVEYPQKNNYAIGFITSETPTVIDEVIGENCFNVFIPTTPNPTSGMLILFPESKISNIDLSVEQAIKYVVSGGLAVNRFHKGGKNG